MSECVHVWIRSDTYKTWCVECGAILIDKADEATRRPGDTDQDTSHRLQALCTAAQTVRISANAVPSGKDYGERYDTAWEKAVTDRARWLLDQAVKGDW